jgi:general nucleoside transport system ATP-binding protein
MIAPVQPPSSAPGALGLATYALGKRFGSFQALEDVSLEVAAGSVHALLGENGAGKSTLVKCVAGFHVPDEGAVLVDGREQAITSPIVARALGVGMVYQHFTLAPGMSVAENLLLAAGRMPALVNWQRERRALQAFLAATPFSLDLDATPAALSAGEKQKLELLKQLYLKPRLLIMDEPTSVLTPQEADEVLGYVRTVARRGECTVLMITHKFREVSAYADAVTVLRRGRKVFASAVSATSPAQLAEAMVGDAAAAAASAGAVQAVASGARAQRAPVLDVEPCALAISGLCARGDRGTLAVKDLSLRVRAGEILGIAGVSGNGQRELLEAIVGQRPRLSGEVRVAGRPYGARRHENHALRLRALPEEPLKSACVAELSVAQNMALRDFDRAPLGGAWLRFSALAQRARDWIAEYGIKTGGEHAALGGLSGGNVQRTVLARELAGEVKVLIAANPVFGLDFAAVAEIHARLLDVSAKGGAVLLISEDLDELLSLADRVAVMSEGQLVFEAPVEGIDRLTLGAHMGGGQGHHDQHGAVAQRRA